MVGEKGVCSDVLDSLRDDPDGPRVDISNDIVAHLGNRITIISDNELPIGPKSERKVLAIETNDEATVAAAIAKLMGAEKEAHRREIDGHVVWELIDCQTEMPQLDIETPGVALQHSESNTGKSNGNQRFFSTTAICVADGQLFLSSHMALLEKVLQQAKRSDGLSTADDYRLIAKQATAVGAGPISFRVFSRTDQAVLPTYELIRTGQMPQSETILGKFLNSMSSEAQEGLPRKQKIDGSQLPDFSYRAEIPRPGWIVCHQHGRRLAVRRPDDGAATGCGKCTGISRSAKQIGFGTCTGEGEWPIAQRTARARHRAMSSRELRSLYFCPEWVAAIAAHSNVFQ